MEMPSVLQVFDQNQKKRANNGKFEGLKRDLMFAQMMALEVKRKGKG